MTLFCREAVGVFGFEILFANDTIFVNVEEPRMRHPFGHSLGVRIQHLETANDLGIRVGQQWKLNLVPAGEVREDRGAVVTDGCQFDPLLLEACARVLQLHELPFAKRSPVRRSKKEQHRPFRALECGIRLLVAELISQ